MKKSILQDEKECYITGSTSNLHLHHIYPGANRKISDREGFWVWLRADWHVGQMYSVHENADLMIINLSKNVKRNTKKNTAGRSLSG